MNSGYSYSLVILFTLAIKTSNIKFFVSDDSVQRQKTIVFSQYREENDIHCFRNLCFIYNQLFSEIKEKYESVLCFLSYSCFTLPSFYTFLFNPLFGIFAL